MHTTSLAPPAAFDRRFGFFFYQLEVLKKELSELRKANEGCVAVAAVAAW
jgi:hypothetical protein